MLIDSHCHINMIEHAGGPGSVINDALQAGVEHMLCVSVDLESLPEVIKIAEDHNCVSASVGIHPNSKMDTH